MNILISQRHTKNTYRDWIDSLENNYIEYFEKFDFNLIPVSNIIKKLENFIEAIKPEGIILTGGGDVDPELYEGENIDGLSISKYRDETEFKLLEIAIRKNIPVLGICRGMQLINVYFGGKLLQDISAIDSLKKHKTPGPHEVKLTFADLSNLLNGKSKINVNSYHNLGILPSMLGKNIEIFAIYEDLNLIEGIYHKYYPIAGIEWHPERKKPNDDLDKILIEAFTNRNIFWTNK